MTQRRTAGLAGIAAGVAVAIGCCLALPGCSAGSPAAGAPARGSATPGGSPGVATPRVSPPARVTRVLTAPRAFGACERRIEREPSSVPTVAIVGASYTAGVGPDNPELSWAAVLARKLRWSAVIYGVSGAGYVRPGKGDLGPVRRLLKAEGLHRLAPALVIIQAGHDDGSVAGNIERQQVERTVALIRAQSPHARIALLTVFTGPARPVSAKLVRIDKVIVRAARAVDPNVIIMDPLAGDWKYARAHHGLHPTAAGDAWIGRKVATILRAHGIDPQPPAGSTPLVCIRAVGDGTASA